MGSTNTPLIYAPGTPTATDGGVQLLVGFEASAATTVTSPVAADVLKTIINGHEVDAIVPATPTATTTAAAVVQAINEDPNVNADFIASNVAGVVTIKANAGVDELFTLSVAVTGTTGYSVTTTPAEAANTVVPLKNFSYAVEGGAITFYKDQPENVTPAIKTALLAAGLVR